jgi:hypothetical protein
VETARHLRIPLGAFTGTCSGLPAFFGQQPAADPELLRGFYLEPTMAAAMESFTGYGFLTMAQAVVILDKVISRMQSSESPSSKTRDMQSLDTELQSFLTGAMKGYRRPGHHCGAIAVGIR